METNLAIAVALSNNKKIGLAAATYASRKSCPPYCPLLHHGCYAGVGYCGFHVHRLDANAKRSKATAIQVARAEARAIADIEVIPGLPLRGHVSGDCPTPACANIVGKAYRAYMERGGGQAYTYTHAYPKVPRSAWGDKVSVLASCEGFSQLFEARKQGYSAAALIVKDLPAKPMYREGIKIIPCQFQLRGIKCTSCRLCMQEEKLAAMNAVVAFGPDNETSVDVVMD